jgi:hypothetical protein
MNAVQRKRNAATIDDSSFFRRTIRYVVIHIFRAWEVGRAGHRAEELVK